MNVPYDNGGVAMDSCYQLSLPLFDSNESVARIEWRVESLARDERELATGKS